MPQLQRCEALERDRLIKRIGGAGNLPEGCRSIAVQKRTAAGSSRFATLTPPGAGGTKPKKFWRNSLAVHPSVIKRHEQSLKRRIRNIETKSKLRTLMKKARQAIEAKNLDLAQTQIREVNKALSKAVSKGIIRNNTASRWLSRLSRGTAKTAAAG
jgi:small subunit ribosomal protein S20